MTEPSWKTFGDYDPERQAEIDALERKLDEYRAAYKDEAEDLVQIFDEAFGADAPVWVRDMADWFKVKI